MRPPYEEVTPIGASAACDSFLQFGGRHNHDTWLNAMLILKRHVDLTMVGSEQTGHHWYSCNVDARAGCETEELRCKFSVGIHMLIQFLYLPYDTLETMDAEVSFFI